MTTRFLPQAALTVALATLGCAGQDDVSVQTQFVCAPAEDPMDCAPDGECERFLTGQAFAYTTVGGFDNSLSFYFQIANQRPPNEDESAGSLNSADALLTEYDLSFIWEGTVIGRGTVPIVNATIPAEGTITPFATVIPASVMNFIRTNWPSADPAILGEVNIRFKGHFRGGGEFETGDFLLPVQIINADYSIPTCTAPDVLVYCPNLGATGTTDCVTP